MLRPVEDRVLGIVLASHQHPDVGADAAAERGALGAQEVAEGLGEEFPVGVGGMERGPGLREVELAAVWSVWMEGTLLSSCVLGGFVDTVSC